MKEIPLTQGYLTKVDDENFYELIKHRWYADVYTDKSGGVHVYAERGINTGNNKIVKVKMSHVIIGEVPKGKHVDHINGDTLDNQRANLRICEPKQNFQNRRVSRSKESCGYIGVFYRKDRNQWIANVRANGEHFHVGTFNTAEEAALARDVEAKKRLGEFARLNFPEKLGHPITKRERHSTSGETGIYQKKNGFQVQLRVNAKLITLGTFATLEEAVRARDAFRDREKPECEIGRNSVGSG